MEESATSSDNSLFPHPFDPVIEFYKQKVDRDAIRANLRLTPIERISKLMERNRLAEEQQRVEEAKRRLIETIHNNAGEADAGAC